MKSSTLDSLRNYLFTHRDLIKKFLENQKYINIEQQKEERAEIFAQSKLLNYVGCSNI